MAVRLRSTLIVAALFVGATWTLPLQRGLSDAGPPLAAVSDAPSFEVTARRGAVTFAGHASSARHEQRLQRAATEHFPHHEHVFELRPFGPSPDWWIDATTELAATLAGLRLPTARLDRGSLVIHAFADDPAAARRDIDGLMRRLPHSLATDVRIEAFKSTANVRGLCEREFATFRNGPVNFFESTTEMRPSAFPVLDRVVALADACREARLSITGHSDSSGAEALNRELSLARARAVAAWLARRGIDEGRMLVAGAGSSAPVATNATRYGRSLNRRIEIDFFYGD